MKRCWRPILSLLAGLIVAQLISTYFVYQSNQTLALRNQALREAGYLPLPHGKAETGLAGIGSALCGGVFFTSSLGAGLTLFAMAAGWLMARTGRPGRYAFLLFLAGWLYFLYAVNQDGFNLFPTLLGLFAPILPFLITWRGSLPHRASPDWTLRVSFALPFIVLGVIWFSQAERRIFSDVRDFLFWSNPAGERIGQFYYDHTLAPAEVFKSVKQKTIRTVWLDPKMDGETIRQAKEALVPLDCLPVPDPALADLRIRSDESGFRLYDSRGIYLPAIKAEFFSRPEEVLIQFSDLTDIDRGFRKSAYYSLIAGMPPVFFMLMFFFAQVLFSIFLGPKASRVAAGLLCIALGLMLLMPILAGRSAGKGIDDPALLLASDSWQARVQGLRAVEAQGLDLASFKDLPSLIAHPRIPIRYHAARLLGKSRSREAWNLLLRLADDPQTNVACMAFQSLPQLNRPEARDEILKRFQRLDHWYVQRYAYAALRETGWRQTSR